jgi:hypothetical protein
MQVERKWCDGFSKDNFKHKFYMTRNLWEEAPLPSSYYTLCLFAGTTSKCHFFLGLPSGLPNGSPKTKTLVVPKLWPFIFFSNQGFLKMWQEYLITFKNIFPIVYKHTPIRPHLTPTFQGFMVKSQISNLIPTFSLIIIHTMNDAKALKTFILQDLFNGVLGA